MNENTRYDLSYTIRINIIKFVLFISLLLTIPNGVANAVTIDLLPRPPLSTVLGAIYTEQQIQTLVDKYSEQYGVSSIKMMKTISCESKYRNIQSQLIMSNGKREGSWGVSQINLYWHPEVTKEQTLDPDFAVEFMAKGFAEGRARQWSCYNKFY